LKKTWDVLSIQWLAGRAELNYGISISTLWLFHIAMGNGPFIDGLPIKNGDFPWLY
jgi:hypothetical protein